MASFYRQLSLLKLTPLLMLLAICLLAISAVIFSSARAAGPTTLRYTIDRSDLPPLNYYDLTLIINISDATSIDVQDQNNNPIPFKSGPTAEEITITTVSEEISIALDGVTNQQNLGAFRKANLKDNYAWAYSHGFDDNLALDDARKIYLDRGKL